VPRTESQVWTIDKILCSNWNKSSGFATVWASNYSSDYVVFELALHPQHGPIITSIDSNFASAEWHKEIGANGLPEGLEDDAIQRLKKWAKELEVIKKWIEEKKWNYVPGVAIQEVQYASLAFAYQHRAKMNPGRVSELLAEDMNCSLSTTKERIRKCRNLDFLSNPGKGKRGAGKVTNKAKNLLKKEGKINE
jgi:hypothetical protein